MLYSRGSVLLGTVLLSGTACAASSTLAVLVAAAFPAADVALAYAKAEHASGRGPIAMTTSIKATPTVAATSTTITTAAIVRRSHRVSNSSGSKYSQTRRRHRSRRRPNLNDPETKRGSIARKGRNRNGVIRSILRLPIRVSNLIFFL
jgi:hypothetical protein